MQKQGGGGRSVAGRLLRMFQFLHQFRDEGSFESRIRKIMVNCALQRLRGSNRLVPVLNMDTQQEYLVIPANIENEINSKELLKMVMLLPPAYKMIFNQYAFDGYKHREIAEMLGINRSSLTHDMVV
jgi:RNA polymerase sigma-70 factor, ECF subfamily